MDRLESSDATSRVRLPLLIGAVLVVFGLVTAALGAVAVVDSWLVALIDPPAPFATSLGIVALVVIATVAGASAMVHQSPNHLELLAPTAVGGAAMLLLVALVNVGWVTGASPIGLVIGSIYGLTVLWLLTMLFEGLLPRDRQDLSVTSVGASTAGPANQPGVTLGDGGNDEDELTFLNDDRDENP